MDGSDKQIGSAEAADEVDAYLSDSDLYGLYELELEYLYPEAKGPVPVGLSPQVSQSQDDLEDLTYDDDYDFDAWDYILDDDLDGGRAARMAQMKEEISQKVTF